MRRQPRFGIRAIALLLAVAAASAAFGRAGLSAERVTVLAFQLHPPFFIDNRHGLTHDTAKLLTNAANGRYAFDVEPVSPARLRRRLADPPDHPAIVLWAAPEWFEGRDRARHLWSRAVLMRDCDALVSRRAEPVRYDGPETLDGHTLGLLRGHRSPRIDDYIAAGGDVRRAEGTTYRETFAKLQAGWIDAVLAPAYALPHLLRANARRAKVRVDLTEQSYSRRVLVLDGHAGLRDFIDRTLNNGPWRRKLHALIARYAGQP